jgi:hypothetical protein
VIRVARSTDAAQLIADSLACLGEVLLGRERSAEGCAALEGAIGVYEQKGIAPAVTATRALLTSHSRAATLR